MSLTENGYNEITERIVSRMIEVPEGLTAQELIHWLKGYSQCQNDIIEIIMELKKRKE